MKMDKTALAIPTCFHKQDFYQDTQAAFKNCKMHPTLPKNNKYSICARIHRVDRKKLNTIPKTVVQKKVLKALWGNNNLLLFQQIKKESAAQRQIIPIHYMKN